MIFFLMGAPLIALVSIAAITMNDSYSSYIQGLLNTMVLDKMSTDSGVERSSWNRQAMQNFFDTFGFGAGNRSVRASSVLFGIPASLGVVGTFFSAYSLLNCFWVSPRTSNLVASTMRFVWPQNTLV
jgi:hypothetical protein